MNRIHVISTSFNSNKFALNNIISVASQSLIPKSHTYIDDMSNDNSVETLKGFMATESYLKICKKYDLKITINKERKFKIKNLFELLHDQNKFDDNDIICILDGDDWLSNGDALKEVHEAHLRENLDYLYTNWMYSHTGELGISRKIPNNEWCPYSSPWITSAMSTFRVSCFREIDESNFKDSSDKFFTMGCDQAYILPILEMSRRKNKGYSKVGFINKPHYIYQFLENENKPRHGTEGNKIAVEAHNASIIIRKRGLL